MSLLSTSSLPFSKVLIMTALSLAGSILPAVCINCQARLKSSAATNNSMSAKLKQMQQSYDAQAQGDDEIDRSKLVSLGRSPARLVSPSHLFLFSFIQPAFPDFELCGAGARGLCERPGCGKKYWVCPCSPLLPSSPS